MHTLTLILTTAAIVAGMAIADAPRGIRRSEACSVACSLSPVGQQ
ncbi:hypothetical protein NO263_08330 [Gluconacetobacter entanii]|uniref:Uncharacterized protein n=1 Tax=Gluconacetobacter entanii TaxID=108528 RepID=A0ABT3K5B1_9PROT|nr:hypothetical protein [Gluconacetobacter entanii]MCW4580589.1 hypothetical protein [Gluconacetobacter entanii]MCW4583904.1 hypothetical protein [Gluconacetobacter entanii]MCW4587249.1 hypothetical protein [Gluconacetobacter entanii]MCW4590584.1 hypothetical protein [Gluconacetobacter entanii]MCW4592873.1 hypothetical protein [Gluconacetobacter entanii]